MKIYFALLITWLTPFILSAQQNINIDEAVRSFSKGTYPSFRLQINQSHLADVQNDWMEYLRAGSKNKPAALNGETSMRGAVNTNISPAPFNVYSTLLETTTGVILTAWFTDNDSVFISKDLSDRDLAVQKYLHDFALKQTSEAIKKQLKVEKGKLEKLQDDLKDLTKAQDKASKKSSESRRSIDRNKDLIINNQNDQQNKQSQVDNQKQVVEGLKGSSGATLDAAKKELKGYESDLKKLVNAKEKLYKEIDKWNEDIRKYQREMEDNFRDQRTKQEEVDKQQTVMQAVQSNLDNLK